MKRFMATAVIVFMALFVLACGGGNKSSSPNSSSTSTKQMKQLKNQDLKKIIPIAKLIAANENELREIEKILSSLGVDFNEMDPDGWFEIKDGNSESDRYKFKPTIKGTCKEIYVYLYSGKGQTFNSLFGSDSKIRLKMTFDDKKLVMVTAPTENQDTVFYHDGKTYCKVSDFLISDEVVEKMQKTAIDLIKNSKVSQNLTDIKLEKCSFYVKSFTKNDEQLLKSFQVDRTTKGQYEEYITGYLLATGKEKYYGGEKTHSLKIANMHCDLQGNPVNTDMFTTDKFSSAEGYIKNETTGKEEPYRNSSNKSVGKSANSESNNNTSESNNESNSPISANAIVGAKHSSADNEDGYNHSATLTTDGDTKTCWAEGVPGLGINENITYYFNGNYKVSGLNIWTGHQKTEDLFYKNARPTAIRIIGSDGSNEIYTLQDTMGMQRVTFNRPITANSIKLVVEKVAPGTKYEDTCIAEVNFF